MKQKDKDDYKVLFKGIKISKREANKVGLGIICGIIGIFIAIFITGGKSKILDYVIILVFMAIGYLWVGNKIFKK